MFYNRGHPKDFNNWADISNDPSWNYANLLEHFKNLETYNGEWPSGMAPKYHLLKKHSFNYNLIIIDQHGNNGPLSITNQSYAPGLDVWLKAGETLGYEIADPNGPQKISFTPIEYNKLRGRRVSSYTGFIKPYQNTRANLKVVTGAYATQVVSAITLEKLIYAVIL